MKTLHQSKYLLSRLPLILSSLIILFSPGASFALTAQEIFALAGNTVAALEMLDASGTLTATASATQIDAQRFVTACEILDTASRFRLTINSVSHDGIIVARDRERNLCLIAAKTAGSKSVKLQKRIPSVGARIFSVSNALGLGVGISEGIVSGIRHYPTGDYIQFTASISPGSEGGALLDEQGQLLGIIDYRRRDGQNVNFASLAHWIDEIETRSIANADNLQRLDAGIALLKQKKWEDLSRFSVDWLQHQADSVDALKLSIYAAKGLHNTPSELNAWTDLRRISPLQADVGVGLGRALLSSSRIAEALELAKQLVVSHKEYANARLLLAQAQHASGLLEPAEQSYRQAILLDAWLIEAYQGLAFLAQKRGDMSTAISIWSRLTGLYPESTEPRIALVRAYLAADQVDHAYTALEKLPAAELDSAVAWYCRGVVSMRIGRPEAAVAAYRKSLDLHFDAPDWALGGIGFAMASMKRYPEAISAFSEARKTKPDEDDWTYQLAINLKDGGRANEALQLMTVLTKKAPALAQYWRQQGFILSVLARPVEAISAMQKSLEIDPNQVKLWRALIENYQTAGQRKEAKQAYQKLLAIDIKGAQSAYRASILPYEGEVL